MRSQRRIRRYDKISDSHDHSRADSVLFTDFAKKECRKKIQFLFEGISEYFSEDVPVILAGNSIHADRAFIAKHLPKLEAKLHYRRLDVSSFKIVYQNKFKKLFKKSESHRALDDIKESIAELKFYLSR